MQLNGLFGKTIYFYNLFSQSATLPVYLFVSLLFVNVHFLSYNFSALNISVQGFSLNFARISGRAVDKLLNRSRVKIHTGSLFLESEA